MQNNSIEASNYPNKNSLYRPEQTDLQWEDYINYEQWSNSSLQVPSLSPELDYDLFCTGHAGQWSINANSVPGVSTVGKPSHSKNVVTTKPAPHKRQLSMPEALAVRPMINMKKTSQQNKLSAPAVTKLQRDLGSYATNPPTNAMCKQPQNKYHTMSNSVFQCVTPRRSESPEVARQATMSRAQPQSLQLGPPAALSSDRTLETRNVSAKMRFTLSDDVLVLKLRNEHGLSWQRISEFFVGRSAKSLQVHYSVGLKNQNRIWLPEEDQMLRKLYAEHERAMWDVIAKRMGSNVNAVGCMSRFDYLTRLKNKELEEMINKIQEKN